MSIVGIIFISLGLAMDAFGVSIGKGLTMPKGYHGHKILLAALFGLFQFMMPVIGWAVGKQFIHIIAEFDHWIIFILLAYLGISMIRESYNDETDDDSEGERLSFWEMIVLAVATSLDAMAVGLTFAFMDIDVWQASTMIGVITFIISLIGIYLGRFMGGFVGRYAELIGGVILILIGLKILIEHLLEHAGLI